METSVLTRNNVRLSGREGAPPMMFAHGFGCDQNMWRFVTPAFADDYRIILFDYVGSGKSDLTKYDPDRYSTLAGLILWRLGHLPNQGESVSFGGLSYEVVALDGRNIDKVRIRALEMAS